MTQQEPKTVFSAEVHYPDGEVDRTMVSRNRWDMDIAEVGDLIRQLLLGMGFSESNVDELLECDCEVWGPSPLADLEDEELPEDEDDTIGTTSDMGLDEELADWVPRVFPSPCFDCAVCCEDTACLHDDATEEVKICGVCGLSSGAVPAPRDGVEVEKCPRCGFWW